MMVCVPPTPSILTILCAISILTPLAAQTSQLDAALQRGAEAMHRGDGPAAESAFREAVRVAPGAAEAHLDLGLVLGREGKGDAAVSELHQAIAIDPNAKSAHMFAGIFLYQNNQPDEARKEFQSELALDPGSSETDVWLGRLELAQGHPERAANSFDRAAELTPNDLNVLQLQGFAHNQVAKSAYARMAKLDPNSWHVHNVQGQLFADGGKHQEAIVEFRAAIQQQPRDPDLYEALGDEFHSMNQLDQAQEAYQKGLDLGPSNPVALYNLGSIEVERGESAAGVPLLQQMQKVYPGSPIAEYYLGRGLSSLGQDDEAVVWLEKSANANPNSEVAKRSLYELTREYRKLHRTEEARVALEKYNRLRVANEKQGAEQVQEWKKLGAPQQEPPPSTTP